MNYTDGLVIRCPSCGALNIVTSMKDYGILKKCLCCDSSICVNNDALVFKQCPGLL